MTGPSRKLGNVGEGRESGCPEGSGHVALVPGGRIVPRCGRVVRPLLARGRSLDSWACAKPTMTAVRNHEWQGSQSIVNHAGRAAGADAVLDRARRDDR